MTDEPDLLAGAERYLLRVVNNPQCPPFAVQNASRALELVRRARSEHAPRPPRTAQGLGAVYRHLKSGGLYTLLSIVGDQAAYVAHRDGTLWWRPRSEFFDGRFQYVRGEGPSLESLGVRRG